MCHLNSSHAFSCFNVIYYPAVGILCPAVPNNSYKIALLQNSSALWWGSVGRHKARASIDLNQELLNQISPPVYHVKYTDPWENRYILFGEEKKIPFKDRQDNIIVTKQITYDSRPYRVNLKPCLSWPQVFLLPFPKQFMGELIVWTDVTFEVGERRGLIFAECQSWLCQDLCWMHLILQNPWWIGFLFLSLHMRNRP